MRAARAACLFPHILYSQWCVYKYVCIYANVYEIKKSGFSPRRSPACGTDVQEVLACLLGGAWKRTCLRHKLFQRVSINRTQDNRDFRHNTLCTMKPDSRDSTFSPEQSHTQNKNYVCEIFGIVCK
jgi:hypothetical protein